ncbi:MAG: hypothetical protein FJ082_12100 [Cyanobacteria bacterium K_Offshore_surface_m2_011]|nr:hypothetical protein [Cyanobacteria bacterium K_Offshore_surface_m2_011]
MSKFRRCFYGLDLPLSRRLDAENDCLVPKVRVALSQLAHTDLAQLAVQVVQPRLSEWFQLVARHIVGIKGESYRQKQAAARVSSDSTDPPT